MSAITLQTQYLQGFRWTLIKFKEIFAVVHTMYYACLYIFVFVYFFTFNTVFLQEGTVLEQILLQSVKYSQLKEMTSSFLLLEYQFY